jgi:hypothetical protein
VAVVLIVVGIIAFLVRCFVHTGWIRLHRDIVVTGQGQFATLFSGFDGFGRMAGWKILSGIVAIGTAIAAMLPGVGIGFGVGALTSHEIGFAVGTFVAVAVAVPAVVYVGLGIALGEHVVVLEGKGPMEALDRAWELADGNRWTLFAYYAVTGLFALLGIFACCIGVWWTKAIVDVGTTEAFLLATRPDTDDFAFSKLPG